MRIDIPSRPEKFSNGLKIFKGSCHTYKYGRTLLKKIFKDKEIRYLVPQRLRPQNVDTEPGDVVIWNLRTCHSGNALRLKYFKNITLSPFFENSLYRHFQIFLSQVKKKELLFFQLLVLWVIL